MIPHNIINRMLTGIAYLGRRRARAARPGRLRVGQGRVMDTPKGSPEEGRRTIQQRKEEEEQGW